MKCCGVELGDLFTPDLFKALAEPNRLGMLVQLAQSDHGCTVSEVAECCHIDLSVVSRHLKTLRTAGVVEATRSGRQVVYRLRRAELAALFRQVADALSPIASG